MLAVLCGAVRWLVSLWFVGVKEVGELKAHEAYIAWSVKRDLSHVIHISLNSWVQTVEGGNYVHNAINTTATNHCCYRCVSKGVPLFLPFQDFACRE